MISTKIIASEEIACLEIRRSRMPARDLYHDAVKAALIKDGWSITHDPFRLSFGGKDMYVDLGAERLVAAEKSGRQIAVEIKSFLGDSEMRDIEQAIGQFVVYRTVLADVEPERTLFIAVPDDVLREVFMEPLGKLLVEKTSVRLLSFDHEKEVIVAWIS